MNVNVILEELAKEAGIYLESKRRYGPRRNKYKQYIKRTDFDKLLNYKSSHHDENNNLHGTIEPPGGRKVNVVLTKKNKGYENILTPSYSEKDDAIVMQYSDRRHKAGAAIGAHENGHAQRSNLTPDERKILNGPDSHEKSKVNNKLTENNKVSDTNPLYAGVGKSQKAYSTMKQNGKTLNVHDSNPDERKSDVDVINMTGDLGMKRFTKYNIDKSLKQKIKSYYKNRPYSDADFIKKKNELREITRQLSVPVDEYTKRKLQSKRDNIKNILRNMGIENKEYMTKMLNSEEFKKYKSREIEANKNREALAHIAYNNRGHH